jgi:hypothetical protein
MSVRYCRVIYSGNTNTLRGFVVKQNQRFAAYDHERRLLGEYGRSCEAFNALYKGRQPSTADRYIGIKKPADPTEPGQARKYCHWLHNPRAVRCPRCARTGTACWCRLAIPGFDDQWLWHVVPPLANADAPAWNYDDKNPAPYVKRPRPVPLERSRVSHTVVCHDAWCARFKGGECNCNLEITRYVEPKRS